jgi:hypothetical protein
MSTPPYPLHPEPMQKSWLERRPLWKIPLGCLTLIFLIGAFGLVLMTVITMSFRSSDVCKQGIAKASENPQVREQIGEPIRTGWLISGKMNVSGSSGNANLWIPVSGPRGRGAIRAVAHKNAGVWFFTCLQVTIEGRSSPIDLLSIQPSVE